MRVDAACEPGWPGTPNEDFCGLSLPSAGHGGTAVVLDGVTGPLSGETGCGHGTAWFTGHLGTTLLRLAAHRESALTGCLADALRETAAAHSRTCDLTAKRTPQATLAVARWGPQWLEYLVLGDCELLLAARDGTADAIRDTRIEDVDRRADKRERRERVARLPAGSPAWAAERLAYQEYADGFRNAPGGYYTAAADPGVADHAVHGRLPVTGLHGIALVTDGVLRWLDGPRASDRAALLRALAERGGEAVIGEVRRYEEDRRSRGIGGGGKAHDDATAVYIAF